MSIKLIQDRLDGYGCRSEIEEGQALREITQEVALAALGRTGFFKQAIFQGGTCLRICYGLNRFSEDLNFVLKEPDRNFAFKSYLQAIADELAAYGYRMEVVDRSRADGAVRKAFIKDDAIGKILHLHYAGQPGPPGKIRIKFEIDTNPPAGGDCEIKYLDFPFVSAVVVHDPVTLFAGKIHALLCRGYIKGRDWYDFLWYSSRKTGIHYDFLAAALKQTGPWQGQEIQVDNAWCMTQLQQQITSMDWHATVEDVRRFVRVSEQPSLDLWNSELFLSQLEKIRTWTPAP